MTVATLVLTGSAAGAIPPHDAPAQSGASGVDGHGAHATHVTTSTPTTLAAGDQVFLAANLNGKNEISPGGTPGAGDLDGRGRAVVRIQGTQVCFTASWSGIVAPRLGHIHAGKAGANGGVVVDFGLSQLPATLRSVTGCVMSTDAVLDPIKTNPADFYVNLHNSDFPGGAIRGQLHLSDTPIDLLGNLRGPLVALADGTQEVPVPGDADGRATAFVRASRDRVNFGVTWSAIAQPTLAHIHAGRVGVPGGVAANLFVSSPPTPLPASIFAVTGEVEGVDRAVIKQINRNPSAYYVNLHNVDFPGGAVRGQLFNAGSEGSDARTFTAPVRRGVQIYSCKQQPDGTFKFGQHDVRAVLAGNIRHSFVNKDTGPPQWVAPDGSAVTGRVISRTPNGAGNIDELELDANQSGDATGRLASVVEILRLNTVGGVAPAGTCNPATQPTVEVPYQADYVFIAA